MTFRSQRINRIRLEFKGNDVIFMMAFVCVLIRIRLEFKAVQKNSNIDDSVCINKIRLEFKVLPIIGIIAGAAAVLIESDWNLRII